MNNQHIGYSFRGGALASVLKRGPGFISGLLTLLLASMTLSTAHAQTDGFQTLYSFTNNTDGGTPYRGLIQASNGRFYGTCFYGGAQFAGTVYSVTLAGKQTTLYTFTAPDGNGINTDGANPFGALVQGTDGNFYGTASLGGAHGLGTVFRLTPGGAFTTLHSFSAMGSVSSDGAYPYGALIQAKDGNFYGTTIYGGMGGVGIVFKMTPAGVVTPVYQFTALDANRENADGAYPRTGLLQGADGNLYGVTYGGGANGNGTVFQVSTSGAYRALYVFTATDPNTGINQDGAHPTGALVQDAYGDFYGTTSNGGRFGAGAIFGVYPSSSGTTFSFFAAHSFNQTTNGTNYGGSTPVDGLVLAADGNLYGTTYNGGAFGKGAIFSIYGPAGLFLSLYSFSGVDANGDNADGATAQGVLVQGRDGSLYGTASSGGAHSYGTVFSLTLPVRAFNQLNSLGTSDGKSPMAGLFQGSDGFLYGTCELGNTYNAGTVFRMAPGGGHYAVNYGFSAPDANGRNADGAYPECALVQGNDGAYYGTTPYGGPNGTGVIFEITPTGFSVVYAFSSVNASNANTEGAYPHGGLTLGHDGVLYGVTASGGHGSGTVFALVGNRTPSVRYAFSAPDRTKDPDGINTDGVSPFGALCADSAGNLVGTTKYGGANGHGTVFAIFSGGAFGVLHTFSATGSNGANADGASPTAALIQGLDGNYYGTALGGGKTGSGTVFMTNATGGFRTLHSFSAQDTNGINADGAYPAAPLLAGGDGNYYGTAAAGGINGQGTVFAVSTTGSFTTLPVLVDPYLSAATPLGGLIAASDGYFYGTGSRAAANDGGAIFRFVPALPEITSPTTASAATGTAFSYTIVAGGKPVRYETNGLPPGVSLNQATGVISGTPTKAGTYPAILAAFNTLGSDYMLLTVTVNGTVMPVITSPATATATAGQPFSYQIVATNKPTSYGVGELFKGITVNQQTGLITGTSTAAGTHSLDLRATNAAGTGHETLMLKITN